jgi:hypothetical protein
MLQNLPRAATDDRGEKHVGVGGMSAVYPARDPKLDCDGRVAVHRFGGAGEAVGRRLEASMNASRSAFICFSAGGCRYIMWPAS